MCTHRLSANLKSLGGSAAKSRFFCWRPAFFLSLSLTVAVFFGLQVLNRPLTTGAAPLGIVSFEFAGSLPRAQEMLASWGERGALYAALSLGVDYLFMASYSTAIALGCFGIARRLSVRTPVVAGVGVILAWAQFAAAALDALENYALIRIVLGSLQQAWASVACWCAALKFLLIAMGLGFAVVAAILAKKRR
ncbi:MAG: hypothetical protein JW900_09905 [Anaerolineae bacterium]|nr:hypothetical protein [Anaerolineae bacterium]